MEAAEPEITASLEGEGDGVSAKSPPVVEMNCDVDKIEREEMEMEEIPLGNDVYKPCSVELKEPFGGKPGPGQDYCSRKDVVPAKEVTGGVGAKARSSFGKIRDTVSSWSITKLLVNRVFICCSTNEEDDEKEKKKRKGRGRRDDEGVFEEVDINNMEEGLGEEKDAVGEIIANPTFQAPRRRNQVGSVWIIDCSDEENIKVDIERAWAAVATKLLIKNSPFDSAVMGKLNQRNMLQDVKELHFVNCDISLESFCSVLADLHLLEALRFKGTSSSTNNFKFRRYSEKEFQDAYKDKDYFRAIRERYRPMSRGLPQRLKAVCISMPMTWQCDLIYRAVEFVFDESELEILIIESSIRDMLEFLVSQENGVQAEDERTWEHLVKLDCCKAIKRSCDTLKDLSLSCGSRFPLDLLKIAKLSNIPVDDVFRWSFYCTVGMLNAIQEMTVDSVPDYDSSSSFPRLSTLSLDLPFVPVRFFREDDLQRPLNCLLQFIAYNNHLQRVSLRGLRPEVGMENWIKHYLSTVSKNGVKVGCTYCSTTLANHLETYDDALLSLAFSIVPEEKRKRVAEIIEPNKTEGKLPTWRYNGMKCLHIINQLPSLLSFDMDRIACKFTHLTKLAIEDYTLRYDESGRIMSENGSGDCGEGEGNDQPKTKSLSDSDMQVIFKRLVSLEHLRLDVNMQNVTDFGLTGVGDSLWTRLSQRNKFFSFWYLSHLKYVFLRGFGEKVTDKSAVYAFSEEFSLKNLTELHLFAPGITNFGKEKIRSAFAGREGFILEL